MKTIRKKGKIEASKKLLVASFIMAGIVLISALAHAWRTFDSTVYVYLIPAVFAELATATGFYYNKSKAENKIKLAQEIAKMEKKIDKNISIEEVMISDKDKGIENIKETVETTDDPFMEA